MLLLCCCLTSFLCSAVQCFMNKSRCTGSWDPAAGHSDTVTWMSHLKHPVITSHLVSLLSVTLYLTFSLGQEGKKERMKCQRARNYEKVLYLIKRKWQELSMSSVHPNPQSWPGNDEATAKPHQILWQRFLCETLTEASWRRHFYV